MSNSYITQYIYKFISCRFAMNNNNNNKKKTFVASLLEKIFIIEKIVCISYKKFSFVLL